ncbi:MAG: glycosyltransferase [Blastocatellia bacterium]|nr:glycosyltransferase [Blastocatellia bacterium]MCS7156614.1 glycosyltransferase [Blastocatellia bacterium]MCX7751644.1 glycosyltransferase [Blastocatellia bacterium]MDW8168744.1 glycosyltransferase [Acidobacteriota bacterium]MDW8257010.1 glycosyltransferase [Acidobacteriota bacterium]
MRLRVLALASYPIEAAATRYRVVQYGPWLAARGIEVELQTFLSHDVFAILYERGHWGKKIAGLLAALLRSSRALIRAARADVVWIQREAAPLGPPVLEWLIVRGLRKPMLLDLDDATFVPYVSPTYGPWVRPLKWFGKTDRLIAWADVVVAGNRLIAEYVRQREKPVLLLPTIVDTDLFVPKAEASDPPVLGWIGSHSTFRYLKTLLPVLEELGRDFTFRLLVVGGTEPVRLRTVEVENRRWALDREVEDFRSLDIGLYPLIEDEWSVGKSGLKAIQYMAVGIPTVASAVGVVTEILEDGVTGFLVRSPEEWYDRLRLLLENPELRRQMGRAAREVAVQRYRVAVHAEAIRRAIQHCARRGSLLEEAAHTDSPS